ncbi:MAG: hypothetical protein AB7G11_05565 [Phycisphaerales bacterium]
MTTAPRVSARRGRRTSCKVGVAIRLQAGRPLRRGTVTDESCSGIAMLVQDAGGAFRPGATLRLIGRRAEFGERARVVRVDSRSDEGVLVGCCWVKGTERPAVPASGPEMENRS